MSRNLFSQIRLRRHHAAIFAVVVVALFAWLTLAFAGVCTRPMLQKQAETRTACSQDMETMNQHGLPTDTDDCSFNVCSDLQAGTTFTQLNVQNIKKTALWALVLPIVITLLFQGSGQPTSQLQPRRPHLRSTPLFYRFCRLLN